MQNARTKHKVGQNQEADFLLIGLILKIYIDKPLSASGASPMSEGHVF